MSVKLRFVRIGKKNHPAYRLCAIESRKARDGQYIENIGFYDPYIADDQKKIRFDRERAEHWLRMGAQPSQTVLDFFKREKISGLIHPKKRKRRKKSVAAKPAGAVGGGAPTKPAKKPKPPKKPREDRSSEASGAGGGA